MENGRKYPDHAGPRLFRRKVQGLRKWLTGWLGVGKAQRLRAETQAEALTTAYRHKLVAELHNLSSVGDLRSTLAAKLFDEAQDRPFDQAQAKPLDLEASYIPLKVREYNGRGEFSGHVGEGEGVERKGLRPLETMSPEEALLRFRHLAVLGDPGAGKTTMLRYLTLLAAPPPTHGGNLPDLPIFVSLGHFAAVPQVNLLDFIISEIETGCDFPGPPPEPIEGLRPYLEERLEEGSVLFLLDGLDEADVGRPQPSSPILHPSSATYRHVVGQINVLAARYPNCPMVVTARRKSWKGLLTASFHTMEVLGFNGDDIQRFIVNLSRGRGDQKGGTGSAQAQDLQDALFQNPQMWVLAANPLLLTLMAFAFEQDGKLPKGRVGLYRRGAELLLGTADRENLTDTGRKHSLLEEVALHFHRQHVLLFPEDELREVIAGYLSTAKRASPDAVGTLRIELEEISGQHGLLWEQINGWYSFSHPTWQEYFAAVAISKRVNSNEPFEWVLEGLHDPWWEGTVLFLAGVLEDATPFLESILAQKEDIFHSNLLLVGRCLAASRHSGESIPGCELRVKGVGLDIIEKLKRLLEGEYHRLLQRQAISVLAEIGGEAVIAFFVALLRRKEIDPGVRAKVAKILGSLCPFDLAQDRDKSVVPDLLAFLTDEKLDPSVRGNIAEALGSLGDESVVPPLLALLPDETVDSSVRGRIVEALTSLGGEFIVSPLMALLPDERIDPYVRERISGAVLNLSSSLRPFDPSTGLRAGFAQGTPSSTLHPPVLSQLLSFLPDEKMHPSVRQAVAEAVGSLGDESVVPDLLALLSDEKVDPSVRGKAAKALGALGAESAVPPLLAILSDEKVNYSVRMMIAETLGVLGENSVSQLLAFLPDEKIDPDVRASIAGALGVLGEKSVVPQLLSLLPDESIDPAVRWRIVDTLSHLGDQTIVPHLRALLPNEEIDSSVRWMVAEALEALAGEPVENRDWEWEVGDGELTKALGSLDDRSRVPQFLALLKDEKLDPSVSGRIIEALGSLGDDRATVEGLAALLDREDIGSRVYEALFHVSRRAGMRVFAREGGGYEVRPLARAHPKQIGVETLRP